MMLKWLRDNLWEEQKDTFKYIVFARISMTTRI